MRKDRLTVGPSEDMSGVRHEALLRRLTELARHQARAREQAPRDRIGGTGGSVGCTVTRATPLRNVEGSDSNILMTKTLTGKV